MSRTRMAIAVTAAVVVAHLLGVALFLDDPGGVRTAHYVSGWAAALYAAIGAVVAARTFERGDYLRTVWSLIASGTILLVATQAISGAWMNAHPDADITASSLVYLRFVLFVAANATTVWGLFLLAVSYSRSGLNVPRTAAFNATWLAISAVAVALAVRTLQGDVAQLDGTRNAFAALTRIASTLGDAASIVLIAPVLRVAYLMRGGRLAGVWWLMGLSGTLWLIYDCKAWIAQPLPFEGAHVMALLVVVRTLAMALVGLAGILQREAVTAQG